MSISTLPTTVATRTDALLPLVGADIEVPLVPSGTARYVDLDGAASTRPLASVAARVTEVLPLYASVHRGAGYLSQVSTALYEQARQTVGRFVGARDDDVTVLVRHTTDALNLLAGAVPEGAAVLVLDCEHHADLLPWQRRGPVTVLPTAGTVTGTLRAIGAELARGEYALLAVTGASNLTGEALPLEEVVALAHAAGTRVLVDGAQLVPHRRFSLAATGADYVAFSGHKTYAPFGTGALVGRRDWLDAAPAYLAGGGAVHEVTVDRTSWAAAPHRHEGGSPNVVGAVALAAACDALVALPDGARQQHERALRTRLVDGLTALPGVRVLRIWPDAGEPTGVVAFTVEGADPGLVAAVLSAEHGIGVRDGRFCAHPLTERLGVPEGALRASVGVGSTTEDVDRLLHGLTRYLTDGPAVAYTRVAGRWQPADDPRPSAGELLARASVCGPAAA
ncbi:aminotransferase class V-fold PLP-dependent enzyme [Modestobacter sp. I12A-02628]|uniref:Aminotransferase class V-fold PLP-dependent enzyme n=1 Tax=Goekera deserti TaxID=2497753 RepID=A0A7K3WHQ9_9ACTN|nr:aminotransferase class V-fold PLP-dependent enzyme [Goekera deserti]MPQ96514.1 aminotransferase class V-fold PLP-dependent enzyme [Goekera deserti]NDI47171.1 aminotransferase class V-fold PLP-dependent enzyme [Goekera deserti]NEL55429.1 aminotransferase class V-fold PLP-dependent enzyme [Goekera deserti]